jgi:hypothetical protein
MGVHIAEISRKVINFEGVISVSWPAVLSESLTSGKIWRCGRNSREAPNQIAEAQLERIRVRKRRNIREYSARFSGAQSRFKAQAKNPGVG